MIILLEANKVADQSIFVSEWLKDLFIKQGIKSEKNLVIYGAPIQIYLILIISNHGTVRIK